MGFTSFLDLLARFLVYSVAIYIGFLAILTLPYFQTHVIYLHRVVLTWFQDVNSPMQWGFLPNQVTPFHLKTLDGETLHAWHVLPLALYQEHASALADEPVGLAPDITTRLSFTLLRDDPESLLVLYFHGAAGTLGSGWRPPSYRAMSALAPRRIHTVAIDYRGFGASTGQPTEEGLLTDALSLVHWATKTARIPSERIVIFAQSMGTAVAVSLVHHLATRAAEPLYFKGIVLTAPFADVAELTSTYSIAGVVPLMAPLARFPTLHRLFKSFLICQWPTKEKLADFVRVIGDRANAKYDITILHAKDDWDIPWSHSEILFWHVIEATLHHGESYDKVKDQLRNESKSLGAGGWSIQRQTAQGIVRQEILEYGLHDRIMSYPAVSLAVWRAFQGS